MRKIVLTLTVSLLGLILSACQNNSTQFITSNQLDVVSREAGSGTRGAFEEIIEFNIDLNKDGTVEHPLVGDATIKDGNGNVASYILENQYSIGYVSFVTLNERDNLKGLTINGVEPTIENVLNQTYEVARPFNMVYHDTNLNRAELAYVKFLSSLEGLTALEQAGAIVNKSNAKPFDQTQFVAGSINLGGSTSVESAAKKAADEFKALAAAQGIEVTYTYDSSGSSDGVKNAHAGTYSIGFASRGLKASEIELSLTMSRIAMDGIAIVVHQSNPLSNITLEEIKKVYTGELITWEELMS
jgi:phosphate transport system substrate-binding protein